MLEEDKILQNKLWTSLTPCADSALSTRVRLARNIIGVPFPHMQNSHEASLVISLFEKQVNLIGKKKQFLVKLNELDGSQKRFLRERNIITLEMEMSNRSAVLFEENGNFSVLINEEDHVRIQVIRPGLQLREAFEDANRIDDELGAFLPYAFSYDLGYLTACPSNLGTGMKLSVMLHLPALTLQKAIPGLAIKLKNEGALLKSTVENSMRSPGSIYNLANKISLGLSEIDIMELMDGVVSRLIYSEDEARDELMSHSKNEIEDIVWRSFGLLSSARRMTYSEAMEHLSNVRLGIILAFLKGIPLTKINNLMVDIQWEHLQKISDCSFHGMTQADEARAELLRTNFGLSRYGDV